MNPGNHAKIDSDFGAREFWLEARRTEGASPAHGAVTEVQQRPQPKKPAKKSEVVFARFLNRRTFLQATAASAGLLMGGRRAALGAAPSKTPLVDVNVSLSRWPLRRLPCDEPHALVAKLRERGVTQAWAGTFDGLLHKNVAAANQRLVEDCNRHGKGLLLPFGSVNPTLPDWAEEIRRCAQQHRMKGIRLHPNYHGYTLADPRFESLLRFAVKVDLVVQLALVMEDERMMHPRLRVEPVDPEPLAVIVKNIPGLRLVLLNALRTLRGPMLPRLLGAGNVSVDLAMIEGIGGLDNLLTHTPVERILFGSHAPLFYFEAAELKLMESTLSDQQSRAIRFDNAARVMG